MSAAKLALGCLWIITTSTISLGMAGGSLSLTLSDVFIRFQSSLHLLRKRIDFHPRIALMTIKIRQGVHLLI